MITKKERKPRWAYRSENIDHKPDWVDKVPHLLYELGDVFFPIPRGRKGWNYPHHMTEYRYCADSEILNAYLECGWGYGISCAGSTAVVDVDEIEYVSDVTDNLPETAYQVTGSRSGVHLFYLCPGLDTRQILHYKDEEHKCDIDDHECWFDEDGDCVKDWEWEHLGEIKCDPHGYVIGPGSVHPSGNKYGPLKGEKITEIKREELMDALSEYIKPDRPTPKKPINRSRSSIYVENEDERKSKYRFYNLSADDVVPWLEPDKRVPHPVHGSSTGKNFMKTEDREKFYCWRHDYGGSQGVALNAQHFLAIRETNLDCDHVRRSFRNDPILHWKAWRRAVTDGLISYREVPYKVSLGYAMERDVVDNSDELVGDVFWDVLNMIKVEMEDEIFDIPKGGGSQNDDE